MIDILIEFIIFIVIVALVILAAKWLCTATEVPAPIAKGILWVLGAVALIVLLVRFVKPLLSSGT